MIRQGVNWKVGLQDLKLKFANTIQVLKATILQVKSVTIMLRLDNENKLLIIKFYFFIFTKKFQE